MKIIKFTKNFLLFVSVKAILIAETARRYLLSAILSFVGLILSPVAKADGDLADMLKGVAKGADSATESVFSLSTFMGVCFILGGIISMIAKKNNSQIKVWYIALLFAAGAACITLDQIATRSQKQLGLTPVSIS
ncbi:hypothetical protein Xmau_03849 [Xenorhabdus mauleonii]|uniref:Conjugal transfer protein TraR n=1 Tax=Xenorhabdus mauleonii TaxID=351675 RepID=A0A1I3V5X4_9GAMM|nr:DUF6750 family protein [Xenorhabdus mauleonii]PHM37631.1 hypothetical protein Xmau_03849 [Xenorhabdus mauleonii]SFJ90313.1 hypothetical protein SAMN05421680_11953 [Xenorhabdus mauleonii]